MRKSAIAKMQELDGNGNTVQDKLIKVGPYVNSKNKPPYLYTSYVC